MGTSVNQPSPRTLNWTAAQAGYRDPAIPIERVASEIWRAALNQETGNIAQLIGQPVIASLGDLAARAQTAADVSRSTALAIARSKQSSLGTDIARRAAIQCIGSADRFAAYTERVFAEATAYLISRDLPGFVGMGRVRNVSDSMELKTAVVSHVTSVVRGVQRPTSPDPRSWSTFVNTVTQRLRGSLK